MLVLHLVDLEYEVSLYLIYFLMVEIVGYFFDKKMVGNLFDLYTLRATAYEYLAFFCIYGKLVIKI